jgi:HK97 family phage major capsid protein
MEDKDMKQEVIDAASAKALETLKKSGEYVGREEIKGLIHEEAIDVLKGVIPVRPEEFDANTPSQKRMVMEDICKYYQRVLGEGKAWEDTTTHVGLEMVPSLVAGRIIEKRDNAPVFKHCTKFPDDKGVLIVESTQATALRMGAARAATAEVTPAPTEVSYSTYGGTAWLLLGNKLIRNATPQVVDYVENSLVRSIVRLHTYEWTLGSGTRSMTGMHTGATAVASTGGIDTLAELTLADTMAAFFSLEPQYADGAIWLLPNTVVAKLATLNVVNTPLIDIPNKTIMGRPYVVLPSTCFEAPANTVTWSYFGDMSYYNIFEKSPIQLKVSNDGKTLAVADQTVIVAQFETDGKVVLTEAINANNYLT